MKKLEKMKFAQIRQQMRRVSCAATASALVVLTLLADAGASSLVPLYGNSAGMTGGISIAELKTGWVITAVCNGAGLVELISWNDTGSALAREGSYTSTLECGIVSITGLNARTVVTYSIAGRVGASFEVSAWRVSSTGAITPLGTGAVGCSCDAYGSIAKLDSTRVVTSTTSGNGQIVTAWLVPSSGDISQEGSAEAPGNFGFQTGITALNSGQVVSVGTVGGGCTLCDLSIIAWSVDGAGTVTQQGSATAGAAQYVTAALWKTNTVVTSLFNGSSNLELITWKISSTGVITREATGTGGTILGLANICIIPTDKLPFTAVLSTSELLSAEVWESSGPSSLTELTSYNSSWAQLPWGTAPIGPHKVVTASQTLSGSDLTMEEWELDPTAANK
jgi:hypothetical protein